MTLRDNNELANFMNSRFVILKFALFDKVF